MELIRVDSLTVKYKNFCAVDNVSLKLSIVLALIPNPRVAFLDELTTGLDPQARHQMWDLLLQLREGGLTIVLVSHYMDEVEAVCDRVAIMDRGRMLSVGTIDKVVQQFDLQTEISFRSSMVHTGGLAALAGVATVRRDREKITVLGQGDKTVLEVLQYLKEKGVGYSGLAVKPPDLETVFLKLVGYNTAGNVGQAVKSGRGQHEIGGC